MALLWLFIPFLLFADPIKVGILHSLTGTMAISETSVVKATQMAIEEINEQGGVLGGPIKAVIKDGASDWDRFAQEAESLITDDKVSVVFGCWTSASRKTVKPIFEKHDHLLFYPVQYEGLESSPNIVYTGAAPNQQIIPAVKWAIDHLGKRFYLIGSDYVFPRSANAIMKDQIRSLQGEIVGEHYILLGSQKVQQAITEIIATQPDAILNTINGDTNVAFFQALHASGITPDKIPTISFSIAESELQTMGAQEFVGDYAAWNYFQSIQSEENTRFIKAYHHRYGDDQVLTDPMEAAYVGVHLWAKAVAKAKSPDPKIVRQFLANLTLAAPEGPISIDPKSQHLWKNVRIGKIREDGQFEIVWNTPKPVRPLPYPTYRSTPEWELFLKNLYSDWYNNWANPGESE